MKVNTKPLQSSYSVIRKSEVQDTGAEERGSERRTHREVGSNLSARHCQFDWTAWG